MRQMISILFISLFSLAFTEAGQFTKIPFVVEHYYSHQKDSDEESLIGFLKNHYLKAHHDDGDEEQDNRLPFKTVILTNVASVFEVPALVIFSNVSYINDRIHNLYNPRADIFEPLNAIFHPPK